MALQEVPSMQNPYFDMFFLELRFLSNQKHLDIDFDAFLASFSYIANQHLVT